MTNPEEYVVNTEWMALQHTLVRYLSDVRQGAADRQRHRLPRSFPAPLQANVGALVIVLAVPMDLNASQKHNSASSKVLETDANFGTGLLISAIHDSI